MPGQPNIPGIIVFDVTNLEAREPVGTLGPAIVIPANGAFDLVVTFDGSGFIWNAFEGMGIQYTVNFYAEGQGLAAPDIDFGSVAGNLNGGGPYQATFNVAGGIPTVGVYEISCRVTFPTVPGMTGFNVPLYIEIY